MSDLIERQESTDALRKMQTYKLFRWISNIRRAITNAHTVIEAEGVTE